jgi:uncharacterized protein (TIGR02271 family)
MADARTSGIYPLDELDDFKVADDDIDPRGWSVYSQDGQKLGEVKELLVDTAAMKVRYLDVELDRDLAGADRDNRHVLFPVGTARLDDADDRVFVSAAAASVTGLPAYTRGGALSRDYENSLRGGFVTAAGTTAGTSAAPGELTAAELDYYAHDDYDTDRFYGNRARNARLDDANARNEQRMTLAEEELRVGKQQVQAGEVGVRKHVETEHVRESVPLTHEEVTIDRRPLSADTNVEIRDQEIRVPVNAEEAVVEKRAVVKEEIVIRKRAVTENQTVEADLRRERVDVDRDVDTTRSTASGTGLAGSERGLSGAADRATNSGPLDRLADKADDLKDRVDGNPASRPGPDATDRRI